MIAFAWIIFFANISFAENHCGFPVRTSDVKWISSKVFYDRQSGPSSSREKAIVDQVLAGNVPSRLLEFKPLKIKSKWRGQNVILQLKVAPDYLAIGTNEDFVRTPLTPYAAQYLASKMGFVMPTKFLVDQIYQQADVSLKPEPTAWYRQDELMRLGSNYVVFNTTIEKQRKNRTGLIAGHKKDVVITNLLDSKDASVAIYGWHKPDGRQIQPLGTPHDFQYEDYSHGIRFLADEVTVVTGESPEKVLATKSLVDALKDPELGNILNGGQGPIHDTRAGRKCPQAFHVAVGLGPGETCPPQPVPCGGANVGGSVRGDSSRNHKIRR